MRNAPFELRPLAGALGAEIRGVDLAADLSDGMVAALRQALLDRLVIFFHDQDLPPGRLLALAKRFGTPNEYLSSVAGQPIVPNPFQGLWLGKFAAALNMPAARAPMPGAVSMSVTFA